MFNFNDNFDRTIRHALFIFCCRYRDSSEHLDCANGSADGRYELPLEKISSDCYADCSILGVVYNAHHYYEFEDGDSDNDPSYALASLLPGPGAFVLDPWAEAGGSDISYAEVSETTDVFTGVGGDIDIGAGNEPGAWGEVCENRYGIAQAEWQIIGSDDSSWIESKITIVNESGEDSGAAGEINWGVYSTGQIIVGSTEFIFWCNSDGTIDVSGTLMVNGTPQDVTGTYYGAVLTFDALEYIRPEVPFDTMVARGAHCGIQAGQIVDRKQLALEKGGWAGVEVHAYQSTDPN